MLEDFAAAGGDVVGVDWRLPLDQAWRTIGPDRAIQGNLDPLALFAPPAELERRVRDVLRAAGGRPGHIFNLGHGVLPDTPIEALQSVVHLVHTTAKQNRPAELTGR
jgi:uroporphyrinogen decarboxylase